MALSKPDLTESRVWANGASGPDVVDPGLSKFSAGWTPEIITYQNLNSLHQYFTQAAIYNNQQGVNEWDAATVYPVDAISKGSDGKLYRAVQEQANNNPVGDGGTNWEDLVAADGAGGAPGVLDNDTHLQGRNFADNADLDLIGVDTSDRTVVGNATSDLVLYSSDTGRVQLIENETGGLDELHIDFMQTLDGTIKAQLGFVDNGSDFKLENEVSGGDMIIGSNGAASVFALQRDGSTRVSIASSRTQVFDGEELANPAFSSEDWGLATEYSGLKVAAGGSTLRSVGFNQMNVTPFTTGSFNFFFKANCNNYYSCDGSGALTLTLQDPGLSVDGQMVMITNTGAGGSTAVTINTGAQTLNWFNGSSVSTGNRSLAVGGICTIVRRDSGVFDIFGSGLS